MKTPTPFLNCSSFKSSAVICLSLLIGCLGLSPKALAVDPPPDGGYGAPDYGEGNTGEGDNALLALTDGGFNTAVGFYSLASVTTGQLNTAVGSGTLLLNTGNQNTATGAAALFNNVTGTENTATGAFALVNNYTGAENTAVGASVLVSNFNGTGNTAVGFNALKSNTRGNSNTAVGRFTLENMTVGTGNTAMGVQALFSKNTGTSDTAIGAQALLNETNAGNNTAIGSQALLFNTTGSRNTALGVRAGANLTTGDNNIDIGAQTDGVAGESGTTRIGNAPYQTRAFIAGIHGVATGTTSSPPVPVLIDSDGQLGTVTSSSRYKTDIKPIEEASQSIMALKPVSFRYKEQKYTAPNFGLIAEEVAKVDRDLVIYDTDGKPYTVRYDAVNAMLLNEFLKEHRKVEHLEEQVAALAAGLQKVRAQLETSRPAPKVVVNQQ